MILTGFQQKLQEFYRNSRKFTGINYRINAAEGGEKITGIPETLKKNTERSMLTVLRYLKTIFISN